MYTEEPRRTINWSNVIKKGIIIVLIVLIIFLIIWLFARSNANSNKVNINYDGKNSTIKSNNNDNDSTNDGKLTNPNAYSESFITNYTYFHDTARDFIEQNNLPYEGNTVKYTLKELINKKVLLPTSYGNSTCDLEDSYISVTNNDGKYTMTTTLVCGKEIAKTNEVLKCSGLCNGNCEKENLEEPKEDNYKIEYEYKQPYTTQETVYNCPSGYTKTGSGENTKCVKSDSQVVSPTKNVTYSCPTGYTKIGSGDNTKCTKNGTETIKATPTTTYSCANGATPNKDHMCPVSSTNYTVRATETTTYSCKNGGTPNKDHMCPVSSISYTQKANVTYSCANGDTPNSNHMCPTIVRTYKCTNGDLVNTSYCRIYTSGTYYIYEPVPHGAVYKGCTYSGAVEQPCSTCAGKTKTVYSYKCTKYSHYDNPAIPVDNKVYNIPATVTYSCTDGSKPDSNHMCPVSSTNYTEKAIANTTYSCKNGGTPNKDHMCPVSSTSYTVKAITNTTYSCTKGKLSGTNCIVDNSSSVNATKYVSYDCPTGYTKNGLATTATCTKGSNTTINPTKLTQNVTKYRTKWSTETSLSGWTKTGKTRTVKAS